MDTRADTSGFYDHLPRLDAFDALTDPARYTPLPGDWVVGVADITGSTQAILEGKYKTVNMIGAAVISAQINAAGGRAFPYIFGGDGAAFASPPELAGTAGEALAAVRAWAEAEFGMELRVAQVPVATIREAGVDVAVARYSASEDVDYAMFSGGGISWAEGQMKAGRFGLPPAPEGSLPDLTGLSCRWSPVQARHGVILSVVIRPRPGASGQAFSQLAERVIGIAHRLERDGHPIPIEGANVQWPTPGLDLEAHALHGKEPVAKKRRKILLETLFIWSLFRFRIPVGKFRPTEYKRETARNTDFRKFDDGLKMTLDCDMATVEQLKSVLEEAKSKGVIDYGLHQQNEAVMTCIVPSAMQSDHVHFVDGAAGGYAQAAAQIKAGL